jgi:hypothetical protein
VKCGLQSARFSRKILLTEEIFFGHSLHSALVPIGPEVCKITAKFSFAPLSKPYVSLNGFARHSQLFNGNTCRLQVPNVDPFRSLKAGSAGENSLTVAEPIFKKFALARKSRTYVIHFIDSFIHFVDLRQVHNLFQSQFPTQCDLLLPALHFQYPSFP